MLERYKLDFLKRTLNHIELVNKYAKKINKSYTEHDRDKLTELFDSYSLMKKENISKEEEEAIDKATLKHITSNKHHPEYWTNADLKNFTRKEPVLNCECYNMPDFAIEEMLCDWCAMSEEFNNSPFEWADKVINKRWLFTEEQVNFINNLLRELWN